MFHKWYWFCSFLFKLAKLKWHFRVYINLWNEADSLKQNTLLKKCPFLRRIFTKNWLVFSTLRRASTEIMISRRTGKQNLFPHMLSLKKYIVYHIVQKQASFFYFSYEQRKARVLRGQWLNVLFPRKRSLESSSGSSSRGNEWACLLFTRWNTAKLWLHTLHGSQNSQSIVLCYLGLVCFLWTVNDTGFCVCLNALFI